MASLPSGWEKTRDRSGELEQLKEKMSDSTVTAVLTYSPENAYGEKLDVMMTQAVGGGAEYFWRYDDGEGGRLEYEYDVTGEKHTDFEEARNAAQSKLQQEAGAGDEVIEFIKHQIEEEETDAAGYQSMAEHARQNGHKKVADKLQEIAEDEKRHFRTLRGLMGELQ